MPLAAVWCFVRSDDAFSSNRREDPNAEKNQMMTLESAGPSNSALFSCFVRDIRNCGGVAANARFPRVFKHRIDQWRIARGVGDELLTPRRR